MELREAETRLRPIPPGCCREGDSLGGRPIERTARIIVRVALAGVVLGIWPGLLEPFQPWKAALLRITGFGLLAWVAAEFASRRGNGVPRPSPLTAAALAWVVVCALSAAMGIAPRVSWMGEPAQREGLLTAIALVGLHLGTARAHRDAADVRTTLAVVMASALVAAAYAQLQLAGLDPIPWSGLSLYHAAGGSVLRPAGPLGNPILLATVMATALPLVLARLAERDSDPARYVPAAALLTASLLMTLSRGAWLASGVGAIAALVLASLAGAPVRRLGWTGLASLAPAFVFGLWRVGAPIAARMAEGLESHSVVARAELARASVALWAEHPLLGTGPDTFAIAFTRVQQPAFWRAEWSGLPVHAHSVPLQVLATLGALGALAGLAWLATAAYEWAVAWRRSSGDRPWLAGVAAALIALLVAGAINSIGLAGAALFAALTALPGATRERAPSPPSTDIPWGSFVSAVVAFVMLITSAGELRALSLARSMRDDRPRSAFTPSEWRAITQARAAATQQATAIWPHDDLLWRLESIAALSAAGAADDSTADALEQSAAIAAVEAVRLTPVRAACQSTLADALGARALRTGSRAFADSARAAFARAEELAPNDGWQLVSRARFELAMRNGVAALEVAQKITGRYPEAAVGHVLSGTALLLLGRRSEARAAFAHSLDQRWEEDAGPQRAAVAQLLASKRLAPPKAGKRSRRQPARQP